MNLRTVLGEKLQSGTCRIDIGHHIDKNHLRGHLPKTQIERLLGRISTKIGDDLECFGRRQGFAESLREVTVRRNKQCR